MLTEFCWRSPFILSSSKRHSIGPFMSVTRWAGRKPSCPAASGSAARMAARHPPQWATSQSPIRRNKAAARGRGNRSPYGGFVTTNPVAADGRTCSKCFSSIAIDPATPAASAQALAASTALGSRSLIAKLPAGWHTRASNSATSRSISD